MKTKEEILKMSKEELNQYRWHTDLNLANNDPRSDCIDCSDCRDCSHCIHCIDCSDCSHCSDCIDCIDCSDCGSCHFCRNAEGLRYAICNVELTKEEYTAKIKELI